MAAQNRGAATEVERGDMRVRFGDALTGHGEAQAQSDGQRIGVIVEKLAATTQQKIQFAKSTMCLQIAHVMLPLRQVKTHLLRDAPRVLCNVPLEFVARAQDRK